MDSTRIESLLEAQTLLLNDRFAEVDSIYREHIEIHPEDPAGYIFRASGLFAEMSDREENLNEDLFKRLLDQVDSLTERRLYYCDGRTAAWMYLFRGHAKAYRSLWESRFGSFMTALKLGLATIDEYEAGLEADSTLYDLYSGIGSYHYWKSAKAGFLKWLGIFKDEKDKGIAELRLAADSSLLHRDLSRSALIWIWLDRKEYDSAASIAEDFVARYPDGKTFMWPLAQARFRQLEFAEAMLVFERLRAMVEPSPGNYYNLIECDYFITQCRSWLHDPVGIKASAARVNEYLSNVPDETRKRQRDKLNFLKRIARR
jgi:hypothetical protein